MLFPGRAPGARAARPEPRQYRRELGRVQHGDVPVQAQQAPRALGERRAPGLEPARVGAVVGEGARDRGEPLRHDARRGVQPHPHG
ncbi:MAG: hypothetical protein ACTMIC_12895, partial [Cellulosimicrobium funkei]